MQEQRSARLAGVTVAGRARVEKPVEVIVAAVAMAGQQAQGLLRLAGFESP
jgi:hypothetical protein